MATLPLYGARATDVIDAMLPESSRDATLDQRLRESTDPAFVARQLGVPVRRPAPPDGRHRRAAVTKAAILASCRRLMQGGALRPSMASICAGAPCAVRSGFQYFPTVEALHLSAIEDAVTVDAIVLRILGITAPGWPLPGENTRLVRAIITGRV